MPDSPRRVGVGKARLRAAGPRPAAEPKAALVPVLIFIGMVTSVISSLGAPLLPTIARVDHVSLDEAEWSLTITLLVGAVASPIMGRLGDGPRRRMVILASLGVVAFGSVLAALPGGFTLLVLGRALHGLGLGLMPLTMAVARDHLPEERSRPAIALLSIATAAGVGLGYPITGILDETWGLHSAFWFGAIVASMALLVSIPVLPRSSSLRRRPLDAPGAFLLGGGLLALLLAVTEGQSWGWTSPRIVGLAAAGLIISYAWVRRERRTDHPLVELGLLRHRAVAVANLSALLIAAAMYMFLPLLTDFVQTPRSAGYGFGASVVVTGLMLLPFSLLSASMSRVAGWFGGRFGERWVIPLGAVVLAAGMFFFALTGHSLWEGFVAMGIAGSGIGFTFAAMPGLIVRSVPPDETGSALGFYQVVRYVGFSAGSALSALLLAVYTPLGHLLPERRGFVTAMIVGAGLCLVTAVASGALGDSRQRAPAVEAGGVDEVGVDQPAVGAGLRQLVEDNAELAAPGIPSNTEDRTVDTLRGNGRPGS